MKKNPGRKERRMIDKTPHHNFYTKKFHSKEARETSRLTLGIGKQTFDINYMPKAKRKGKK